MEEIFNKRKSKLATVEKIETDVVVLKFDDGQVLNSAGAGAQPIFESLYAAGSMQQGAFTRDGGDASGVPPVAGCHLRVLPAFQRHVPDQRLLRSGAGPVSSGEAAPPHRQWGRASATCGDSRRDADCAGRGAVVGGQRLGGGACVSAVSGGILRADAGVFPLAEASRYRRCTDHRRGVRLAGRCRVPGFAGGDFTMDRSMHAAAGSIPRLVQTPP